MISLHNTVRTPGSRIVIGPWPHGGRWYSSPFVGRRRRTDFDHVAEMVRFFDLHLRDVDRGVTDEAPVHYFTTGAECWNAADSWTAGLDHAEQFHLDADGTLSVRTPQLEGTDSRTFDAAATTGPHSRFGKHLAGGRYPVLYPDRANRDRPLFTYDSHPLSEPLEITGHPLFEFWASVSREDCAFFVYLEDVTPDGTVVHVTDGLLRASRRRVTPGPAPYWTAGPWRSGARAEESLLDVHEPTQFEIELFPVSHRFDVGHAVRLTVAGADADTFVQVPADLPMPRVVLHRGPDHDGFVTLPVVSAAAGISTAGRSVH